MKCLPGVPEQRIWDIMYRGTRIGDMNTVITKLNCDKHKYDHYSFESFFSRVKQEGKLALLYYELLKTPRHKDWS